MYDFAGENSKYNVRFDDSRVCKSFLLGCCPHDILASTVRTHFFASNDRLTYTNLAFQQLR